MATSSDIQDLIDNSIQFISPNEPVTPESIKRLLDQIDTAIKILQDEVGSGARQISLWSSNVTYARNDVVLYMKAESKQVTSDVGKRTFVFLLVSQTDGNSSTPNYDMVDGIPDFSKSNWSLLNPMSYLMQDTIGMKDVVEEVFNALMYSHLQEKHCLIGSADIKSNLIQKDYQNLVSDLGVDEMQLSILNSSEDSSTTTSSDYVQIDMDSAGIMQYNIRYSFDIKANPMVEISNSRYYYQKSPVWDESDKTIFAQRYVEDDMFSVAVNERTDSSGTKTYTTFNNLRYGTNVFYKKIEFETPFLNDEYCVFFDTYGRGDFVFGYDKSDIASKSEPTYDAVVSMPMIMNKTAAGFEIVLPIHTYFNSIQQYKIGVPWKNEFRLQAIGRYR